MVQAVMPAPTRLINSATVGLSLFTLVLAGCAAPAIAPSAPAPSAQPSPALAAPSTQPSAVPTENPLAPEASPLGDIPDNQVFVTFASSTGGYQLQVPEGWA